MTSICGTELSERLLRKNSPHEAIRHNERFPPTKRKQTPSFNTTLRVRHKFRKYNKSLNRDLKKRLEGPQVDTEHCRDFTIGELRKAISKMRRKGAPAFLTELGSKAQQELQTAFPQGGYQTSYRY